MKIFISYRRKDSGREVGRIRDRLKREFGEEKVFRDLVDIPSGVDFRTVLDRETKGCDVMLVIIGPDWAGITDEEGNKRLFKPGDFTRIEVETGLAGLEKGTIRVFPVIVQNATMPSAGELPPSISQLHNQNAISIHDDPYFDFDMDRLIGDIKKTGFHRIEKLADFEPETVYIPEGSFWMGSPNGEGIPEFEKPQHLVELPAYRIGKYPVANKQYAVFMRKTGRSAMDIGWKSQKIPEGRENHPVTGVSWYDALAYCNWLSEQTRRPYSLPNEAQWEKACRGGNRTIYPWGDDFDPKRCNHGRPELAAVNKYPEQNNYGCFDFVGNVPQWTCSLWGTNYAAPDPDHRYPSWDGGGGDLTTAEPVQWDETHDDLEAPRYVRRVLRGSSFGDPLSMLRCSYKSADSAESRGYPGSRYGFRVAMAVTEQ